MIIRTLDDVFVNINNITRIKFNFSLQKGEPIEIEHPVKMESAEDFYDVDFPLADFVLSDESLALIRDMFIEALEKNKPYFDFRDAFVEVFKSPTEKIDAMESIEKLYDGRKGN